MIIAIGDSITYAEHLPREQAWTTHLERMMWDGVINEGVCSDTTRLALERFPKAVQQRQPRTVIIQLGANDANRWETDSGLQRVSAQAFRWNLIEMASRCWRAGATRVVYCTIARSRKPWPFPHDCEVYSGEIRRVAAFTGCLLYDAERDLTNPGFLDLIHLDAQTNYRYAQGVAAVLNQARLLKAA